MFNLKELKIRAKKNLKEHYFLFVIACLLAAFLGSAYSSSLSGFEATKEVDPEVLENVVETGNTSVANITVDDVLSLLYKGKEKEADVLAEIVKQDSETSELKIGVVSLGTGKGVLSGAINKLSSGKVFVTVFQSILTITNSKDVTTIIFVIIVALLYLASSIFIKDTYNVAFRRIFLESYKYEKVKSNRFLFLFRVKKATKAAITIFIKNLYETLWSFTIIGGFIKYYSYYLVPYIVAENPDINHKDAITLSRDMMNGHKWECFKLEFSFILWELIGSLTFGLLNHLYVNPYLECVKTEYYAYLRDLAKKANINNIDLLNDIYLYEKADVKLIEDTYADVYEMMNDDIRIEDFKHSGIRGFFENNFGIILYYDQEEDKYNQAIEQEVKIEEYKTIIAKEAYPGRLFPIPESKRNDRLSHVHYLRHYSVFSLIALFFIFAFIGWSWEVSLHLVKDGVFVNRGVLHGPWLPIYGFGGFFILIVLYKLRKKPVAHIIATIILCGIIEYATSWYLEATKGTQWWNYSGYFLNINGRICAEGLLVFALAGTAIVYILGPIMDNQLRKINQKALYTVCIILLVIFSIDFIYSSKYPNTGKGITDYDKSTYVIDREIEV